MLIAVVAVVAVCEVECDTGARAIRGRRCLRVVATRGAHTVRQSRVGRLGEQRVRKHTVQHPARRCRRPPNTLYSTTRWAILDSTAVLVLVGVLFAEASLASTHDFLHHARRL